MEFIELFLIGISVGILSAFFGVGGGIVMMPILSISYPSIPEPYIIATSLSVIFFNSIFNIFRFRKKVTYDSQKVVPIIITSILFAWLSSLLVLELSPAILKLIFLLVIVLTILRYSISSKKPLSKEGSKKTIRHALLLGTVSGSASGLTGLGGGAINVPLLHTWLHIPFKEISAYSNLIMIFTTLSSTLSNLVQKGTPIAMKSIGLIIPFMTMMILIGSFIGSKVGTILHQKTDGEKLKRYFIFFIILIIMRTFLSMF